MFRHKEDSKPVIHDPAPVSEVAAAKASPPELPTPTPAPKSSSDTTKELLEKNLKWSQIIYEQNRRINNKLLWTAIANWLRLIFWIVVIGASIWFSLPLYLNYKTKLDAFFYNAQTAKDINSPESFLKLLPIDSAKQEQLKALLK